MLREILQKLNEIDCESFTIKDDIFGNEDEKYKIIKNIGYCGGLEYTTFKFAKLKNGKYIYIYIYMINQNIHVKL